MNRRGFIGALAAAAALDPEKLLWVPKKKLISIPAPAVLLGWPWISMEGEIPITLRLYERADGSVYASDPRILFSKSGDSYRFEYLQSVADFDPCLLTPDPRVFTAFVASGGKPPAWITYPPRSKS